MDTREPISAGDAQEVDSAPQAEVEVNTSSSQASAIGRIERVSLRQVWQHEATDFTVWLQENIDELGDIVGMSLSSPERERSAGDFSVDIVVEDDGGDLVVIENQLEKSDHDHLGKLLTYMVGLDASAAIWIVSDPRPEHVKAVAWLNESTSASFYLLKLEAVRIGDSPPAPLLTLIVHPSEESREVGETKRNLVERHHIRRNFWTSLLDRARETTQLHGGISPSAEGWVGTGAGKGGLAFNYVILQHDARVELYIDRGKGSEEQNRAIFEALATAREDIEARFGGDLDWHSKEGVRACSIRKNIDVGGWRDEDLWPELQEKMIDAMVRLEQALRPHIDALKV